MRRQVQALLLLTLVLILTACGVSQTPPTGWKYIYTGNHKCHYFVKDGGVHNMTYVKQYLYNLLPVLYGGN